MSISVPSRESTYNPEDPNPVEEFAATTREAMGFWPPVPTESKDLAGGSLALVMFRWTQNLAETGAQMRKRSTVALSPEKGVLQKISSLFPKEPVTEENFSEAMKLVQSNLSGLSLTTARICAETYIQAIKDLFGPTAHQYLRKFADHPVATTLLKRVDRDLFLQLPGREEDALRIATKLQKRIESDVRLTTDPDIDSLQKDFARDLEKLLEKGTKLFAQPGIR
jgi:hypothetical protein